MEVEAIRRYPVKAMGGERLERVRVEERGLAWDRWCAVVDREGRLACHKDGRRFRRRDAIADYTAAATDQGVTVSRGERSWELGPELDTHLSEVMGDAVQVLPEQGTSHMDDSPVSLIGTASLRHCAERYGGPPDPRRLRANLTIATDEPFVEESWVGRTLQIGTTTLRVTAPVTRCRTIDLAQDGVTDPAGWLTPLGRDRDLELAVYAEVIRPGEITVGDRVRTTVSPCAPSS